MITPRISQAAEDVARHYDDLNKWYLEVWGEHVHHGLWETGTESQHEAVEQLTLRMARETRVGAGTRIVDIGCGYGGTARILGNRLGADVIGYTLSKEQYDFAVSRNNGQPNPQFRLQNWFENDLPNASVDVALSIESSEHMEDKVAFFREVSRVLKPGGRFAIYAWLARDNPRPWEVNHLLEPICREGRLPGMGTVEEYRQWFSDAGFVDVRYEDLSRKVKKTWPIIVFRMARRLTWDPEAWRYLFRGPNRIFGITIFRIWLAYNTGSMQYGLFVGKKAG